VRKRQVLRVILLGLILLQFPAVCTVGQEGAGSKQQVPGGDVRETAVSGETQPSRKEDSPSDAAANGKPGSAASAKDIANQANNPAAPLTIFQFRNILLPSPDGKTGAANSFELQPVLPIGPFKAFPWVQLMKITIPIYNTVPGDAAGYGQATGDSGFGDLQLFDLISIKQSWGRWGFGPALTFPTASDTALGAGKWQAGPSAAFIYTGIKDLTAGAIVQNPISYAGSADRADVNQMIITPTFTFNLEEGWFLGLSDYDWTFDWENDGGTMLPLGVQVGRVIRIGKQPFSLSFEVGRAAVRPAGTPDPGWILGFEVSPIFNFHLGPGEKVKLR
jgi:hypothetical protein